MLNALGYRQGAAHMEAFITGGGLVFSEIGLRRGGARIAEAIDLAASVDLRELPCLAGPGCLSDLPVTRPIQLIGWFLISAGQGA
ncbi:MAG TPA: hypothetical protein VFQ44_12065 [Streptosporangiaceae bacterium]|nr:hypothetical protein [Streptosporangiaceae bacterium]